MKIALVFFIIFALLAVNVHESHAQTYQASLILDEIPSKVSSGDIIVFSGQLITADGKYVIPQRTIYIKDDVDFGVDTILGSVTTDENGKFSASWTAVTRKSGSYDFYAVFEGEASIEGARSETHSVYVYDSNSSGSSQYPNYYQTTITLDNIQSSIYAGQSITFTGKLTSGSNPVSNAIVKIMEDDPLSPDQLLSAGKTDSKGRFFIPWQATKGYFETDFDIYATFDGDSNYLKSRSPNQILSVLRHSGSISLDPIPKSATIGDVITFSGKLELNQGSPEGAIVYIKDEDALNPDDLLATAYVNRDGRFFANWFVTDVDADSVADIYAVFEGNDVFYRLATCDPNPTMDYGGSCSRTIPLYINYGVAPKPTAPSAGSNKEYMDLYYSLDFSKNPRVAIVPSPDSYNDAKKYIITVQEGIQMWQSHLDNKYGGNWNIEFEVITPGKLFFTNRPDVVVNLVTPEQEYGCNHDFYGYARISQNHIKPVQTTVCVVSNGKKLDNAQVAATSAHEFIHAIGLGHTWNKQGDLMCSIETVDGKQVYTCPNYNLEKSKTPSDLNLAGVTKLYGTDGFKNPNNNIVYGTKFFLDQNIGKKTSSEKSYNTMSKTMTDSDKDGIPDYKDRCKNKPETYNGYRDTDGCPDKKPK